MEAATDRFERRLVEETTKLRVEMSGMEARLSARISETVRWSFAFWAGQLVAMTAIMSVMLGAQ